MRKLRLFACTDDAARIVRQRARRVWAPAVGLDACPTWNLRATRRQPARLAAPPALKGGEDLRGVAGGLHFFEDVLDTAVGADQERGALHAEVLAAIHTFLFPDAVGFGGGMVGVGNQGERQVVLGFEFRLRRGIVGRGADHDRAVFVEGFGVLTELDGFRRSAGGIGLGEEIQNDAAAAQGRERERLAGIIERVDVGRGVALFQ